MNVSDYDYQLPDGLIAQYPPTHRTDSRLLVVAKDGALNDRKLIDIAGELRAGDLLVLNDTRVIPARVYGRKQHGGKVEILLERIISPTKLIAQIRASKSPKAGQKLTVDNDQDCDITVIGRHDNFFELEVKTDDELHLWFERIGHIPLPPYINRADELTDTERYQTVFAKTHGAVAAPTAGLHYDQALLQKIKANGVSIEMLTLHVGAGTYQPVRVDNIIEHKMHTEIIDVPEAVCVAIKQTKAAGGRVVAVGTTVVRSLETAARAAQDELIKPYAGETDIFIYPGFKFKVVDLLQTNFHLPKSTLLMLVSAFAGHQQIMHAYQHAIKQQYRFFSYGDAMLLTLEE